MSDQVAIQRAYYQSTAADYDAMHLGDQEHELALAFMISMIRHFGFRSVLDVGTGTGRAIMALRRSFPELKVVGIEPSRELRERGHAKGAPVDQLIDGDVQALAFADGAFDLVSAFGVLHHVPKPRKAVTEMLRVARRGIFISDANNFGQGSLPARMIKRGLNSIGLWPLANFIKTKGRGYTLSDEDGLAYSYSVFDDYRQIAKVCPAIHLLNTRGSGPDLYRSAGHLALLGLKPQH
jgi:SAM-dependent methyltransferase